MDEQTRAHFALLAARAKEVRDISDPYEKQSIEYSKFSVEFSKIIVTNLHLINAGGLLATPTISKYLGFDTFPVGSRIFLVAVPAGLFLTGLLMAALCGLATYKNFQRIARGFGFKKEGQIAAARTNFPLLPHEQPYTTYEIDNAKIEAAIEENSVAITRYYRIGITSGFASLISFCIACLFYGAVVVWPTIQVLVCGVR